MADPTSTSTQKRWHVDKTIPLALVASIMAQTLVGTWWASSFAASTTTKLEALETRQKALDLVPERIAKQEEKMESALTMLKDIKSDMRDLTTRSAKR